MGSVILIACCLVGSAFFSASETALMRLRQVEVDVAADRGAGPGVHAIRELLRSTSRLLVTILLGNNVVNILGASVAAALAVSYLGPEAGVAVSTLAMTVMVLVFCEILPKAVAAAHPRGISQLVALPLYLIHQGLRPVHALFDRVIEPVVTRVAGRAEAGAPASAEELLRLARAARSGGEEGSALAIMSAAAEAGERIAQEIMVPRLEIAAFPAQTPPAELLERMLEERYTRAPIYEGSIDRILGAVHLKDLVSYVRMGGGDVRQILKPVLRVPERKLILPLLAEMQRTFVHVAIVKDEHGVTQGMLTQEDILEEIVGEIRDEFDQEELRAIRQLGPGEYEALGRVRVLDFNRATGWQLDAEPGDTLSGLVFNGLGRAPRGGDEVRVGDTAIGVSEVSGTRIARVRVRRAGPDDAPA